MKPWTSGTLDWCGYWGQVNVALRERKLAFHTPENPPHITRRVVEDVRA